MALSNTYIVVQCDVIYDTSKRTYVISVHVYSCIRRLGLSWLSIHEHSLLSDTIEGHHVISGRQPTSPLVDRNRHRQEVVTVTNMATVFCNQ